MNYTTKTHIDTFTITLQDDDNQDWLEHIYSAFDDIKLTFVPNKTGRNHFEHSARLNVEDGTEFATVCWGGISQRNRCMLSVMGQGCMQVKDWQRVYDVFSELPTAKMTRLDIALDVWDGSLTLEQVYQTRTDRSQWRNGLQGRPPAFKPVGDMYEKTKDGRTLYVGTRDSDVYTRIYEKGLQLFSFLKGTDDIEDPRSLPMQLQKDGPMFLRGDYVRFEVEFKAKTTILPFTAFLNPDGFFAGSYPYAANLVKHAKPVQRLRIENTAASDLDSTLKHISQQYGSILNTAITQFGLEHVLRQIVASHPSNRLIAQGIKNAKPQDAARACVEIIDQETGEVTYA